MNEKETEVYAIYVDTEEIYLKCLKEPREEAIQATKDWVSIVHPDPLGRFQAFLYLTREERQTAYEHIKKVFKTAQLAKLPAYVETKCLKNGGRRDES